MFEDKVRFLSENDITGDYALESVFDIENAISALNSIDNKLEWFKNLKRHRTSVLDQMIDDLERRSSAVRDVILRTMNNDPTCDKTLQFPGVGKVTCREIKGAWEIEDESVFIDFLDKIGRKADVVQVKEVVDKRKAKSMLNDLSQTYMTIPGVYRKAATESLSVSFEDNGPQKISASKSTTVLKFEKLSV